MLGQDLVVTGQCCQDRGEHWLRCCGAARSFAGTSSPRQSRRADTCNPREFATRIIDGVYFSTYIFPQMPRAPLTQEELDEFRRRAIEAAELLFASGGADAVTMRALAKDLGCSPMTPYRYFDDQEHLLAAVRAQAFQRLAHHLAQATRGKPDPMTIVRRIRAHYIEFASSEPNLYQLMFSVAPPKTPRPDLEKAAIAAFAPLRAAVTAAVNAGQIAGEPLRLAHLIWAELHGLVSLHASNKLNFGLRLDDLSGLSLIDLASSPSRTD